MSDAPDTASPDRRTYWLDLFTGTTWQEFLDAGGQVSGFRESRWKTVQRIEPGDYFLCYLTGVSRFIGILEVTSAPYKDDTPIWKDEDFPCRLRVRTVLTLEPETAVPALELRDRLTVFRNLKNPNRWSGAFRGSPARWKAQDGQAVVAAIEDAARNPVRRPVDKKKLARRPRALRAKIGLVSVPETDEPEAEEPVDTTAGPEPQRPSHTEIQWMLLKLGSDMGLDVWVARNDRSKEWDGQPLSELPNVLADLPLQFDDATNQTIELIDVLWLEGNSIVAAFEIESTTSIYSGLLRMSDLLSMQPNLNIPLYIVAPDERRHQVFAQVNRPTFMRLPQSLVDVCRYVSFSSLRDHMSNAAPYLQYLKPDFVQELSESCELDES